MSEKKEQNDKYKEKLESGIITRTFRVSGMPVKVFEEVDQFCKENFGDSRWTMIWSLIKGEKEDYKFAMLFDEIERLKEEIQKLKEQPKDNKEKSFKTFGGEKDE